MLLGRVGRAGCDLFEEQIKASGGHGSWLRNKLCGELIWFFGFMGSSWKLSRQICDAVEVTRALKILLSGWRYPAHGCPEGRG